MLLEEVIMIIIIIVIIIIIKFAELQPPQQIISYSIDTNKIIIDTSL